MDIHVTVLSPTENPALNCDEVKSSSIIVQLKICRLSLWATVQNANRQWVNLTRCDCTTAVVNVLQAVGTFNSKFKQVVNMELAIKTFVVRRWSGYFQCQSSCNRDAVELKKPSISDAVVRHPCYRTRCHELAQTRGRSCFMIVYHDDLHLGSKSPRKNSGNCTGHHCCVKSTGV